MTKDNKQKDSPSGQQARQQNKDTVRDIIVPIRLNREEYGLLCRTAEQSGHSRSEVLRRALLKVRLYHRLTEKEAEALAALTDARGDLVNVLSALRSTPEATKQKLFRSEKFMEGWIRAINTIVEKWNNITESLLG